MITFYIAGTRRLSILQPTVIARLMNHSTPAEHLNTPFQETTTRQPHLQQNPRQ